MTSTHQERTAALPLPQLDDRPKSPLPAVHVAVSTMDSCGRVADRSALRYLGWRSGTRIDFAILDGIVTVTEQQSGPYALAEHDYLRMPAEVRTCARIDCHDRLFLLAVGERGALLIYPTVQLITALRSFTPELWGRK